MRQVLLVAALDERQLIGELIQSLTQPGHIAVPEDAQRGRDQPGPLPIGHAVLGGKKLHDGLGGGEPDRLA